MTNEGKSKAHVLVVEDEVILLRILEEALGNEGYTVSTASDGELGLELATNKSPDIILLDLILPKMDGFAVLEQIKKQEKTKNIPIIVLTNLGDPQDVEKATSLGATNYLVKANYQLEDVMKKVDQTLQASGKIES